MQKIQLFVFLGIFSLTLQAQSDEITTYYLIRHAEKVRTDKTDGNPDLTEIGQKRALFWSRVFKDIPFEMVYTTNYNRTIQTASPTAKSKNLEIQFYDPREMYDNDFKLVSKGKKVLIVGHSNTTPQFVNKIIKKEKYNDIEDRNNSNLFIVTIIKGTTTVELLKIPFNNR